MHTLYTIGHSTHTIERFIELLSIHSIAAVCDVRSSPYSKFNPQFNREPLRDKLKKHQISYVFLGRELGPRSDDPECYIDGRVQYDELAKKEIFHQGLNRLIEGMKSFRIAMMCAEKDPITCHRMILVCQHLSSNEIEIKHILEDGSLEDNCDSERRLMKVLKIPELQLFDKAEDLIKRAYKLQGEKIAHVINPDHGNPAIEGGKHP